jgi:hypothetical protein
VRANSILGMSVREFLERATHLIIRESDRFPRFDKRIDIEFELDIHDVKIGRNHRVKTKLRITAISCLFDNKDKDESQGQIPAPNRPDQASSL